MINMNWWWFEQRVATETESGNEDISWQGDKGYIYARNVAEDSHKIYPIWVID